MYRHTDASLNENLNLLTASTVFHLPEAVHLKNVSLHCKNKLEKSVNSEHHSISAE